MKRIFALLGLFLAFPFFLFGGEAKIKIVDNSRPKAVIVIPDTKADLAPLSPWKHLKDNNPLPMEYAADFLRSHVKESTGAELQIFTEGKAPAGSFIIALGPTAIAGKNGIDPRKLPTEAYLIKSIPDGILIVGNTGPDGLDQGTLFGVYRFLEEFCGVRWYFAGRLGRVVPQKKGIEIDLPISIKNEPCFPVRMGGIGGASQTSEWHQVTKFGMSSGMIANHTEESWPKLYGKSHPEYFGLDTEGNSCLKSSGRHYLCYSQPGVLEQHLENIRNYLKNGDDTPWQECSGKPAGKNIPLGPNDIWQKCQCPKCTKLYAGERDRSGRYSDLVFSFAAKLAAEMKKIDPDLKLWCLAYQSYLQPPENPGLKLPDNLCITLCLSPTTTAHMADQKLFEKNIKLVDAWHGALDKDRNRLLVWNYFGSPIGYLKTPVEHPHVLAKFINHLKGRALGMFTDSAPAYRKTAYFQLFYMGWFLHRQLWDPSLEPDKMLEEYCTDLFGPAAPRMIEFYKLMGKSWEDVQWTRPGKYTVPTSTVFNENYTPDTVAALKNLLLQARSAAPENTIYLERMNWFTDEVFGPFIARSEAYHLWKDKSPEGHAAKVENATLENCIPREEVFANSAALPFSHFDGLPQWVPGSAKTAYDQNCLYVEANFKIAPPKDIREWTSISEEDDFVIQLKSSPRSAEYLEILIPPSGKMRFSRYQGKGPWQPSGVKTLSKVENGEWKIRTAIPWNDVFSNGTPPTMMQVQFLRHFSKVAEYDCWSPTLTLETYQGVRRFGKLHFPGEGKQTEK